MKSEDEFDAKYHGDPAFNWDRQPGQEGHMETYSPHVDRVWEARINHVWTVMDSDSFDGQIIVAGRHHVNRVMYFISLEPWEDEDEEYVWWKSEGED